MASIRWKCVSSNDSSGYFVSSALANERSSAKISMPAKPPPMTVTVSRRSRSGPAGRVDGLVEVREHPVADVHGLLDRLEAHGLVGDARDRERARHGARGDHDDVVLELIRLTDGRLDGRRLVRVVDVGDLAADDVRALQVAAVRDDRVTRLNGADGHLGENGWYVMYGSGSTMVTSASPERSCFSSFHAV
jgi:hypothetical protein